MTNYKYKTIMLHSNFIWVNYVFPPFFMQKNGDAKGYCFHLPVNRSHLPVNYQLPD